MNFQIEIAQSEDRCWRFRVLKDTMWIGGFDTYQQCYDAAVLALRTTAVAIILRKLRSEIAS